jgi:hypothetical protein
MAVSYGDIAVAIPNIFSYSLGLGPKKCDRIDDRLTVSQRFVPLLYRGSSDNIEKLPGTDLHADITSSHLSNVR